MTKPHHLTIIISIIVSVLALTFSVYTKVSTPKVAYVRVLDVLYKYNGMKMAHTKFRKQAEEWRSNVDTLERRYHAALADYKSKLQSSSNKVLEEDKLLLDRIEADYKKYASVVNNQAQEEEKKLTDEVVNQVNAFVEEYAKKKGYDIVFGAEGSGNIMYGNKGFDLTDEIINKLNEEYKELP